LSLLVVGALFFVGIDWAAENHAVCVLDATGRRVAAFSIEHSAAGFSTLVHRLGRLAECDQVAVAIERPDGRLVDTLLETGFSVVPVSPNAIKTWRESEAGSGAKSDAGDAYVIADYLRCRAARLDPIQPFSAHTMALRTVVRTSDDLVDTRVAATNQLAALLDAHWPGAKAIFAGVESPIALAFLTRYPTAGHAKGSGSQAPGLVLPRTRLQRQTQR
jgi:transposase